MKSGAVIPKIAAFTTVCILAAAPAVCTAAEGVQQRPAAPFGLQARPVSPQVVELSWRNGPDNARWLRIEQLKGPAPEPGGYNFRAVAYTGAGATDYRHKILPSSFGLRPWPMYSERLLADGAGAACSEFEPGAEYRYRVTAVNDAGESGPSAIAGVRMPTGEPQGSESMRIDAGPDIELPFPDDTALLEGKILEGDADSPVRWSRLSGPGNVLFTDPESPVTGAAFSHGGLYELKLKADSGSETAYDIVRVNVYPEFDPITVFMGYFPGSRKLTVVMDAARGRDAIRRAASGGLLQGLEAFITVRCLETEETIIEKRIEEIEWEESGQRIGRELLHLLTAEYSFHTPPLDGIYQLAVTFNRNGRHVRTIDRDRFGQVLQFQRRRFPWENNRLGISDQVPPPFEPVTVSGSSAGMVLRRYHFNDLGLLDSVIARGRELLADSMSLNFTRSCGEAGSWSQTGGRFVRAQPHQAVYTGAARAQELNVRTTSTIDYDGAVKVELEISPGDTPAEIANLYLDIPMRREMAGLKHIVVGMCYRNNPAGTLRDWTGTFFVPYIWLGEMDRGLAWFADNDAGFIRDLESGLDETLLPDNRDRVRPHGPPGRAPLQQIIVEEDRAVMRIFFVNRPAEITERRRIVFGLQASPTKPMPEDFRKPVQPVPPHGGNNVYWAMHSWYGDRAPRRAWPPQENDTVSDRWHIIDRYDRARREGRRIDREYLESWLEKQYSRMNESDRRTYRAHLMSRFNRVPPPGPTLVFLNFYTQSMFDPEWLTFQDEWHIRDFRKIRRADHWKAPRALWHSPESRGPSFAGSLIDTTPSFNDWFAWNLYEWYRRGLGIYDDNGFWPPRTNSETTSAYMMHTRDDNDRRLTRIVPSHSIWAIREYNRRNWVLMQQTQPETPFRLMKSHHMTNDMVVPIMTWNTTLLDIEWWHHGLFGPARLRVHSTGRQVGAYPHVHQPIFRRDYREREQDGGYLVRQSEHPDHEMALRADWGMHVVHEILRSGFGRHEELETILNDFGYGEKGTAVFNYWDEHCPVSTGDDMVKSLAVENDGNWLIVLVSWRPEPVEVNLALNRITAGKAYDAETGEELLIEKHNAAVSLDRYGVKLVRLEEALALGACGGQDRRLHDSETYLSGSVTLSGKFPQEAVVTKKWRQIEGPGEAVFTEASSAGTGVRFTQPGRYVLRLTAEYGALGASDDVLITVDGRQNP